MPKLFDFTGTTFGVGILVIAGIFVAAVYNKLVRLRQKVRQGAADIDAQLRQRHDLIPNLVEAVKGYAGHEAATLQTVVEARNIAASGEPSSGNERGLRVALDNVLALSEDYPELRASENFQALQDELGDVEDKLAASRRALNAAVARFNTAREAFPAVLFADLLGFDEADFNRLDDSERGSVDQPPQLAF